MTHEGLTILPVFIGMNVPKLYMSTGLQICLSQRPLRWACTEGLNRQDQRHHFSVSKNVVVFLVPGTPPAGGAGGSGAQEGSQASEKLPYGLYTR